MSKSNQPVVGIVEQVVNIEAVLCKAMQPVVGCVGHSVLSVVLKVFQIDWVSHLEIRFDYKTFGPDLKAGSSVPAVVY